MKKIKFISVVLLSLVLMFTISTAVLADNETDPWATATDVTENVDNNTSNEENSSNENLTLENENNDTENLYDSLTDNEENENNTTATDKDNLADTGLSDSTGVIALVVVLSSIVAIYSSIKIRDYNNL